MKLDYNVHCKLPFGDYVQTHEEDEPRNVNAPRDLGAISLGPMENLRGGYKFFNLNAGKLIERHAWTPIPMTQEAIDKVISYGNKGNKGLIVSDYNNRTEHTLDEDAGIAGAHGPDTQQQPDDNFLHDENE